ncbi:hypothetical protein CFOL_v3_12727 [Cephalotus follicularis]|uniref:Integrator complex subunit 7 n=1 Tax=Cephalotus follicularis TaxID=3775 RepID=A0A1Q3BMG5_CEPFO|nr:hypothetical protein CFOL_v3_12727 [Cephalotus follicularis]
MEINSAACAMEWSIELEKALRSKRPGRAVEAILQMGTRLRQWSGEQEATVEVYNMFGLVPGEDRLFANAILLRLADAFRLGDKNVRLSVARVFLAEFRQRRNRRKNKRIKGIVSKSRVHNHEELLRRVKVVFDTGDVESRALTLVLFGCWADFSKNSAQIRYVILSSLVSSHVLEVKASLFAAGCFCELSDDFGSVVLEMLIHIVTPSDTLMAVRLAGVKVFAKMGCSLSVADRAYKTGLQLLLDSLEEEILIQMMISLSKLASRYMLLISEQVDMLLPFLSRRKTLLMRATALRCLHFIFVKGVCLSSVSASVTEALLSTLDERELPSAMHCEALQILHKIFILSLPKLPSIDTLEFNKLFTIVENASQSPMMSKSLLAIRILAGVSIKLMGRKETDSDCTRSFPLPPRVILLIMDRITLLVKPLSGICDFDSKVLQLVQSLFNLLLHMVGEHPDLGYLVLEKVGLLIEYIANMHDSIVITRQASSTVHETLELKQGKNVAISLKIVYFLNRFLVTCLEHLNEAGVITIQVYDKVKLLVECVRRCNLFDYYTQAIYSLLLHSRIIWDCNINKQICDLDRNKDIFLPHCSVEHNIFTLECAKKMLTEKDYWYAYRAATHAACQGAWITSAYIFGQLIKNVQSDVCYSWLNSLAQFAHSERTIQFLLLPEQGSSLAHWLGMKKLPITLSSNSFRVIGQNAAGNIIEPTCIEALVGVHYGLWSSGQTLEAASEMGPAFYFQRWFLALRAKYMGIVLDMLKSFGTIPFNQKIPGNDGQLGGSFMVDCLKSLQQSTKVSFRLMRLSQEFDLIAASFVGMDVKSTRILSALSLSCLVLAFSFGFTLFIPNLIACENSNNCGLEGPKDCFKAMLVQKLVGMLWHIDQDTSTNLCLLFEDSRQHRNCFHLQATNQNLNMGCEAKDIFSICSYVASTVLALQNEAKRMQNEEILAKIINDCLKLMVDVISKGIRIPFRTPTYFFKVRPCIGSQLFAANTDTRNTDEISVLRGTHLSLNLCLQLKNVPPDLPFQLIKVYCILSCSLSFQMPRSSGGNKEQMQGPFQAWENDDLVEMNEELFRYVTESTKKNDNIKRGRDTEVDNDGGDVKAFARFDPKEKGQGFASCLLDISCFPEGSYAIKWHSCCIDSRGSYWSLLPLNTRPVFTVKKI